MSYNAVKGTIPHDSKMRVLAAVRSLALQGARIETYTRTLRFTRTITKGNADSAVKDSGCGAGNVSTTSTTLGSDARTADTQGLYKALTLYQTVQLSDRAIRKAQVSARTILAASENLEFMQNSKAWCNTIKTFMGSPKAVADTRKLLAQYGFNIDVVQYVIDELAKFEAPPALAKDLKALKLYQKARRKTVASTSSALSSDDLGEVIDNAPIDLDFSDGNVSVSVRCENLPPPLNAGCIIIVIGVFIVVGIIALGNLFVDLFNATDDDNARTTINSATCDQLSALPIDRRLDMIRVMIDGPTGDDDEAAIARLLECSTCEDVQTLVSRIGIDNLIDEFQGSEWDRLMLRLQQCSLVDFGDWDDDATRLFINNSDCATLNALELSDIRQLTLNMFSGSTGDEDENAIIRLIQCLPCSKRRALTLRPDMSYDDFDDEVDGEEWDRLDQLFRNCGITE